MSQNENLLDLVNALYRWRKPIIICCILAAIISSVAALLLPNYYNAKTVIYAASPDLAKPLPIGISETKRDIYGTDTDLDRLFSIANSNEITNYLIEEFNLYERYEIKKDGELADYAVRLMFAKSYKTEKNKYDALEINFEDKDPVMAAEVANAARIKIDEIGQEMIKESQRNLLSSYELAIKQKGADQDQLISDLKALKSKYKIYNSTAKGEVLGQQLTEVQGKYANAKSKLRVYKQNPLFQDSIAVVSAKVEGLKTQLDELEKEANNYTDGSGPIEKLGMQMKEMSEQLALDNERYKQLRSALETPFSAVILVQEAEVPHIKSRPIRWMIVAGTTAVTFFLTVVWALFMHQYKGVNWKSVFSDEPRS